MLLTQHRKLNLRLHRTIRLQGFVLRLAGVLHVVVVGRWLDAELRRHGVSLTLRLGDLILDRIWKKSHQNKDTKMGYNVYYTVANSAKRDEKINVSSSTFGKILPWVLVKRHVNTNYAMLISFPPTNARFVGSLPSTFPVRPHKIYRQS